MGLQGFSDKLTGVKEKAAGLGDAALEKMDAVLEDFKKAKSTLETFGFKVAKFKVEMGVMPEINSSIEGFVKDIQDEKIQHLIEANSANTLLVSLLQALLTAKNFQERVELKKFEGVIINMKLGVSPKISVDFLESAS